MARITIDPVTRIEGHLCIDVEVDGGSVQKAWASCTMWRGIETILQGRDPREGWVFAQRFCGPDGNPVALFHLVGVAQRAEQLADSLNHSKAALVDL